MGKECTLDGFFDFFSLRTEERLLKDVRILGLDVETTGLDPLQDEIIELGIVESTRQTDSSYLRNELIHFEQLFQPSRMPLSMKVTEITGITNEHLAQAEPIGLYAEKIISVLDGNVLVMHNADFDLSFLKAAMGVLWDTLDVVVVDTLRMSRELLTSERYSLSYLAALFGLNPIESHRAAADAATCLRLFSMMYDQHPEWSHLTVKEALHSWIRL